MQILYNTLMFVFFLLGWPLILFQTAASRKRRKTFLHRLGLMPFPRGIFSGKASSKKENPIWVHALSVGEVLSAIALVKQLRDAFKDKKIIFSVSTLTGFEIANRFLGESVEAITYFPYDILFSVKRAVKKIDPDFVVIVESDIWPNFLYEIKRKAIPVFLVNARLSDRSFSAYKRFSFLAASLFSVFDKICAQSTNDTGRFRHLGISADRLVTTGNIKFDQEFDPLGKDEIDALRQQLGIKSGQKVWIAGSTHEHEETILLEAYRRLKRMFPDLLLIIAPRNVGRSKSVKSIYENAGFASVLMQDISRHDSRTALDVIIIDTIGILRKLYALGDIAFIGGSLMNLGGHNPLEPAVFSKPVLFGTNMSNFKAISNMLLENNGACMISDAQTLLEAAESLLKDYHKAQTMGQNAYKTFYSNMGAVKNTIRTIQDHLDPGMQMRR